MKVKRFNNLWAMGLILCGVLLVALYLIKIAFPEFIVGVAEIPSIVKFGNYVDTHKWAYYLFNGVVSFFAYYFYCCACCRKKYLNLLQIAIIILSIIILFIIQEILPSYYFGINTITLIATPTIICFLDKKEEIKYLYSTCICFSFYSFLQILSLEIRGIITLINYPNTATFTILSIDLYIVLILLYNFYNFKENK